MENGIKQIFFPDNFNNIYIRSYHNDWGWSNWSQIYPDYSNQLFTEHGYIVYVNGLIVQWSYEVINSASPSIAYYPIAFTNTCRNVQLTSLKANESDTSAHLRCGCVYTYNPEFLTAQSNQSGYFMWHAVGY